MHSHFGDAAFPKPRSERRHFNESFDKLLSEINFESKKSALRPENVRQMERAFRDFFARMDWPLAAVSFGELLGEKTGEHSFRADGKTPNWYHEARELLFALAPVRTGLIRTKDIEPYGGLEVLTCTILRHDSWEDLGKSALSIYAGLERHIHSIWGKNGHDDAYYFMLRQKAVMVSHNVDLLTRKIPRLDHEGQYVRKPTGKFIKDDRFGGQINIYMDNVKQSPITAIAKYYDGIDGMMSRNNVGIFNDAANRSYNEERRMIYGRRAFDEEIIEKYPFLEKAVKSADAMLGILLVAMETVVDYSKDGNDPENARPIRIGRYMPLANKGFSILPKWAHPIMNFLEDLEEKALSEPTPHTSFLLNKSFYPALLPHFGKQSNYGASYYLPPGGTYGPNMA